MTPDEQHRIFDRWIDQHKGLVFKVVHASTMTPEDRNDLFQDIAIQLWKSVPHFKGNAKESTWVFRVALNTAAVWTRRESRYRTRMESRSDLDGVIHEEVRGRNERLDWLYDEIRKLENDELGLGDGEKKAPLVGRSDAGRPGTRKTRYGKTRYKKMGGKP